MNKLTLQNAGDARLPAKLAVTRHEAAAMISVSPPTLDRLVERGLLHPSRATRRPLFSLQELERFLRETTASF